MNRAHYAGDFAARSRRVRAAAEADPSTTCWRCGRPAIEGDPWQAGHVRAGDPRSPLLAEHRSCNVKAGRRMREPRPRLG